MKVNRTIRYRIYPGNGNKHQPEYTSQTCSACGHADKANRTSQSKFKCRLCGYTEDADYNAALNILALGIEASGRGEAFTPVTSMIRQLKQSALAQNCI